MTYGLYRVSGRRTYRGHAPGEEFIASIDPAAERRAVARRDIKLIRRIVPRIEPGTFTLPDGWLPPPENRAAPQQNTEAPEGAFSMGKEH